MHFGKDFRHTSTGTRRSVSNTGRPNRGSSICWSVICQRKLRMFMDVPLRNLISVSNVVILVQLIYARLPPSIVALFENIYVDKNDIDYGQ